MTEKLLLKPAEVVEVIGVSRKAIYEMVASGELPSIRIGRRVRIPVNALREWIEQQSEGYGLSNKPDKV